MILPLNFSSEVLEARTNGQPVVALESTIITHGMPYPDNLTTAMRVESVIRKAGAVPATIAVMRGRIHVGLDAEALSALAQTKKARKLSRADLAVCLASGETGSTTVAATMICAALAGIHVFATGGIGGVHKGAEHSFDISADLNELSRTPVTVVAAGAKAILDIPKTLEVLETNGVPVIVYGADEFPAFWSRSSGLPAPLRMDRADDIAKAFRARQLLGLSGGQLVANPIPAEAELTRGYLEPIIAQAVSEAAAEGISAKQVTPYLLDRIYHLTDGKSLGANIALVENNAKLAAEIALALG